MRNNIVNIVGWMAGWRTHITLSYCFEHASTARSRGAAEGNRQINGVYTRKLIVFCSKTNSLIILIENDVFFFRLRSPATAVVLVLAKAGLRRQTRSKTKQNMFKSQQWRIIIGADLFVEVREGKRAFFGGLPFFASRSRPGSSCC